MIWLIGNKGMLGNDVEKLLNENNLLTRRAEYHGLARE